VPKDGEPLLSLSLSEKGEAHLSFFSGTLCKSSLPPFTISSLLEAPFAWKGAEAAGCSHVLGGPGAGEAFNDLDPESLQPRQRTSGRLGTVPHPAR
jgi:hypothetical protein